MTMTFYGDGVNLAARLQVLPTPGGIACSAAVQEEFRNKVDLQFLDHCERTVKNIVQRVHVYFESTGNHTAL